MIIGFSNYHEMGGPRNELWTVIPWSVPSVLSNAVRSKPSDTATFETANCRGHTSRRYDDSPQECWDRSARGRITIGAGVSEELLSPRDTGSDGRAVLPDQSSRFASRRHVDADNVEDTPCPANCPRPGKSEHRRDGTSLNFE
jgi:hypothetical protein